MNGLHSSFAFSNDASPSCSTSKALFLARDVNYSSGTDLPYDGCRDEEWYGDAVSLRGRCGAGVGGEGGEGCCVGDICGTFLGGVCGWWVDCEKVGRID